MNGGAIVVGKDVDTWYMCKWAGVDLTTGNPLWEHVDPKTGEITAKSDYKNATLQHLGTLTPNYSGGFSTSMS